MESVLYSLVTELGGNKQETRFEDTQRGGDRNTVKILDLDALNVLIYVFDCHFVKVSLFTLKQEEKLTLSGVRTINTTSYCRKRAPSSCA